MASLSLTDLLGDVTAGNLGLQQSLLETIIPQQTELLNSISERATSAAEAQKLSITTAGLAQVKAQDQAIDIATRLGTNPDAATYKLGEYIDQKNAAFQEARALQQQINEKRATTLADPLKWIEAQLTVNNDVARYNAVAQDYNLVEQEIGRLVDMTQEGSKLTNSIAKTKTVESVKADAEIAAVQALNLADKAKIDALQTNADGMAKVVSLKNDNLSNVMRIRDQQMQEANYALARQNSAMQAQRLALDLKKDKEESQSFDQALNARNMFLVANGAPPENRFQFQVAMRNDPKGTEDEIRKGVQAAIIKSNNPSQDARVLAETPFEALAVASKYQGTMNLAAGPKQVIEFVSGAVADIRNGKDPAAIKALEKPATASGAVNAAAANKAQQQHSRITTQEGNIYAPPQLNALLADPEIAKLSSASLVLQPLLQSGLKQFDSKVIVSQIINQAKLGKIGWNQAIDEISFLGIKSIAINNELKGYRGVAGLPMQTALNMPLDTTSAMRAMAQGAANLTPNSPLSGVIGSMFGGETQAFVNLADKAAVQEYVNKVRAGDIVIQLRQKAAVQNRK